MNEMKVPNQNIELIPIDLLAIGDYQRDTDPGQVREIATEFNDAKLGVLLVSKRDGKYWVLDGAHRTRALSELLYTHARCIVLEGLTYEDETKYFRTQRDNTRALTRYNFFTAGLKGNDPVCKTIYEIVQKNGFEIKKASKSFDTISAVHALETVVSEYGFDVLDTTLRLLRETWEGLKEASSREFIVGMADFVFRFGDVPGFAANMQKKNINLIWQDYIAGTMYQSRGSGDPAMRKAVCRAIVKLYNKGLGPSKRLHMEV